MKTKLMPTGLYNITEGTLINAELKAYAEEIDTLFNTLDTMLAECFIPTASDYGLSLRESLSGKTYDGQNTESRREKLLMQERLLGSICNPSEFDSFLRSCGLSRFDVSESFSKYAVIINVYDDITEAEKNKLSEKVRGELPPHVSYHIKFSDGTETVER